MSRAEGLPLSLFHPYKRLPPDGTTVPLEEELCDPEEERCTAVQPRITSEWAQYCYYVPKVPVDGKYYFNLNVGYAMAYTSYYIDDITLTSEPNGNFTNWMATAQGDLSLDLRYTDGSPVPATAVESLAVTMKKHDFPFGLAYSTENFAQAEVNELAFYKAKAGSLFNAMVPENAFKWPTYEPKNNSLGINLIRQFYNFSYDNDFQFMRMHTIEWFLNDPYAANLKRRIERDVAAFPGLVKSLDVFNEILDRRAYAETCNLFSGGPNSVIVQAFKWAAAVNPSVKLCLNDYGLIDSDRWINLVELVQWLRSNGAPVSCVGAQSHLGPQAIDPDKMAYRIDMISRLLELPVEVTEVSFWSSEDPVTYEPFMNDEAAQADGFQKMLTTYFSHPNVTAVLLWGFVDTNHYIPNGGIFRADGSPKPAGTVVEQLITSTWNTSSPSVQIWPSGSSLQTFRGFYGRYDIGVNLVASSNGPYSGIQQVNFPAAAGASQTVVLTLPVPPPALRHRKLLVA
eukprot:gene12467-12602_t